MTVNTILTERRISIRLPSH
uniref:Uncharacterized protein n=1 Tax=Anguilla anguilla TaxID=7936 RepID=A0A0E9SC82_ANGAN